MAEEVLSRLRKTLDLRTRRTGRRCRCCDRSAPCGWRRIRGNVGQQHTEMLARRARRSRRLWEQSKHRRPGACRHARSSRNTRLHRGSSATHHHREPRHCFRLPRLDRMLSRRPNLYSTSVRQLLLLPACDHARDDAQRLLLRNPIWLYRHPRGGYLVGRRSMRNVCHGSVVNVLTHAYTTTHLFIVQRTATIAFHELS